MERGLNYYLGFPLRYGTPGDGEAVGLWERRGALVRGERWWVVVEILGRKSLGGVELWPGLGCYCVVGVFLMGRGGLMVLGWL